MLVKGGTEGSFNIRCRLTGIGIPIKKIKLFRSRLYNGNTTHKKTILYWNDTKIPYKERKAE